MKRRPIFIITIVCIFLLVFSCATVPLKDYEPESTDEATIKKFFITYENLYNEHNVDGLSKLFHPDAQILAGGPDRITVGTEEYIEMHREGFKKNPDLRIEFYSPKIKVTGDKAQAKFSIKSPGSGHTNIPPFTYYLVKENDSWLITRRTY